MELSLKIKNLIKSYEGLRLEAYRCPAGVLTIGYGHTGPDVTEGSTVTRVEADRLFDRDIAKFAASAGNLLQGVALRPCQFDAIVSLAYNIGLGNLRKSTLLRKVKAAPGDPSIRDEFMKHVKARINGVLKTLPGLVKRRRAEADHYFGL